MNEWHATRDLLVRFAAAPESIDDPTASSLELHLLGCDQCREAVASAARPAEMADGWDAIVDRIDQPRPTLAERLLGRLLPSHVARVVAATPALRVSWLVAVTIVVAAVVAAARAANTDVPFLTLAPLVPLAGVALSFGPGPDPAGESAVATPLYGAGLVLRRTIAVLASSLVVLAAGTLALPGLEWRDAGWVLPALGLTLGALALSTWVAPFTATALTAAAWLLVLQGAVFADRVSRTVDEGPLFGPAGQLVFAALIALALLTLNARRLQLSTVEHR